MTTTTTPKTRTTTTTPGQHQQSHQPPLLFFCSLLLGSPDAEPRLWMPRGCPASTAAVAVEPRACPTGPTLNHESNFAQVTLHTIDFNIYQQFSTCSTVHHARSDINYRIFEESFRVQCSEVLKASRWPMGWGTEHTAWLQLTWAMSQP